MRNFDKLSSKKPKVAIITGSKSDLPKIEKTIAILDQFGIAHDLLVASAHRTPKKVQAFAKTAEKKYDLIIAGAGMAAHLPGMVAAYTSLPVIGIPMDASPLKGFDALYAVVQMPPGIPVATVAIDGVKNAAVLAAQILGIKYPALRIKVKNLKKQMAKGKKL